MGKEYNKVMTNEAIGAKEQYLLTAKYAMRITNSGEFLHAAPWSMRRTWASATPATAAPAWHRELRR